MKKTITFCLTLVCVLCFVACSTNVIDNSNPQTDNTPTNSHHESNTYTMPDITTSIPPSDDDDVAIKNELTAKVGIPFRLWKTEGMSLWCFTINENFAEREYSNSMEGQFIQKSLSWEIENGELIIDGEWKETFTLDLEKMEATSKTDGKVYRIVDGDA